MSRRPLPRRCAVRARSDSNSRRGTPNASPLCQPLEPRLALSATVALDGTLIVEGSPQGDTVTIQPGATNGSVILTGVPGVIDGTQFTNITGLRVDLRSGDDVFSLTGDILDPQGQPAGLLVLGGNGQDDITLAMTVGSPQVRGGNSHDTINGGPAGELLKGGRGMDSIFGNAGEDRLEGQLGRDSLFGGPNNDSLFGGNQADQLWGNGGGDLLEGGLHRDSLFGGTGLDQLFGGAAGDRFNGPPAEALDFTTGDDFFSSQFNPDINAVLLGPTFWNRLAAGEGTQTQRNTDLQLAATTVLSQSYFAILSQVINFRNAFNVQLNQGQQAQFRQQLIVVTNQFSPEVLANPAGLTEQRLTQFRDDLVDAVDGSPSQGAYSAFLSGFFDQLLLRDFVARVNALPANASGTQAFLFGADSVFNVADLP